MWKLEYSVPKGLRHNKGRFWICIEPLRDEQESLWWFQDLKKFLPYDDKYLEGYNGVVSSAGPRLNSVKAFKRFLRKNTYLKDYKVVLVSRYYLVLHNGDKVELDVEATWEE